MLLISDLLLLVAALVAIVYCHVLALRLRRLSRLDSGLGGAIVALSRQADDLARALREAQASAGASARSLQGATARAELSARRLEVLISALQDLPEAPPESPPAGTSGAADTAPARPLPAFLRRRASATVAATGSA